MTRLSPREKKLVWIVFYTNKNGLWWWLELRWAWIVAHQMSKYQEAVESLLLGCLSQHSPELDMLKNLCYASTCKTSFLPNTLCVSSFKQKAPRSAAAFPHQCFRRELSSDLQAPTESMTSYRCVGCLLRPHFRLRKLEFYLIKQKSSGSKTH